MSFLGGLGNSLLGAGIGLATGGLGGALIGGAIGYSQDASNANMQRAAQQANEMNLAYWQMQNYYNSPVQQMARLKEAGLNPMLVYGSGNVAGNSSTAIGAPQTYGDKVNAMAGLQGVQALADLKHTGAQISNTEANTGAQQANTLATYQDIQNMQTANKIQQAQLEQQLQNVEMGAMDLEVAKAVQNQRITNAKTQVDTEAKTLAHENFKESGTFMGNLVKFLGGTSASVGNALGTASNIVRNNVISDIYTRRYR